METLGAGDNNASTRALAEAWAWPALAAILCEWASSVKARGDLVLTPSSGSFFSLSFTLYIRQPLKCSSQYIDDVAVCRNLATAIAKARSFLLSLSLCKDCWMLHISWLAFNVA